MSYVIHPRHILATSSFLDRLSLPSGYQFKAKCLEYQGMGMVHFGRKDFYKFRGMVGATAGRFDLGTCDHVLSAPASPIPYSVG